MHSTHHQQSKSHVIGTPQHTGVFDVVCALFISQARRRWGIEAVLAAATLSFVVAQSVLAAAHSVAQALPATFIAGMAWVAALTSINVAMQVRSPDHILGRCLSIYQAVTFGGMAVGSWAWGVLADVHDLPFALHAAAASGLDIAGKMVRFL